MIISIFTCKCSKTIRYALGIRLNYFFRNTLGKPISTNTLNIKGNQKFVSINTKTLYPQLSFLTIYVNTNRIIKMFVNLPSYGVTESI